MLCIYCSGGTSVTNSRPQKRTNSIWRRRQCAQCGNIFTTHETAAYAGSWVFAAKDGSLQPFVRERLFLSLYDSLKHRDAALDDAAALTNTVLGKLLPQVATATLQRAQVVAAAQEVLQRFDHPAATHYQAFHPM